MNRSDESATAPLGLGFILACAMLFIGGQALGEQPVLANEKLLDVVAKANRGNRNELRAMLHAFKRPGAVQVSKDALPELVRVLKEDDAELQLLAAHGLYALKSPQTKDALVQFLGKKDFRKLEKRAHAGEISERSYESQLRASSLAVMTLGEIGDKSVIPLLQSLRGFKDLKFEWGGGPVEQALAKLGSEGLNTLYSIGPDADDEKINKAS
ncbi:MAG: hypothetical protein FJ279_14230, partial [Planctomycetes bacterium]|nr:hypothetical protein [Planctomycetota bacterium]